MHKNALSATVSGPGLRLGVFESGCWASWAANGSCLVSTDSRLWSPVCSRLLNWQQSRLAADSLL